MNYFTDNQLSRLWKYKLEYFSLACTPHEERCTQAGENAHASKLECLALAGQLERMYGKQEDAELFVLINNHEFGRYYELGVMYKELTEQEEEAGTNPSLEYAQKLESGIPDRWDAEAIKFLEEYEHPYHVTKVIPITRAA